MKFDWQDFAWPPKDGRPYAQHDRQRSALSNALVDLDILLREVDLASDRAMLITHGKQIRQAEKEGKDEHHEPTYDCL